MLFYRQVVLLGILISFVVSTRAFAVLVDDFEDGDATANPIWTVTVNAGSDAVVPDPFRPDNLVYQATGSFNQHRILTTPVAGNWRQLEVLLDFAVSDGNNFDLFFRVEDDEPDGFNLGMKLSTDTLAGPDGTEWFIADTTTNTTSWINTDPGELILENTAPENEWWRLRMGYDATSNVVNGEIRRISDNGLVASRTFTPTGGVPDRPFTFFEMAIEQTSLQYLDNVTVNTIPEPSSAAFLAMLVAAMVVWLLGKAGIQRIPRRQLPSVIASASSVSAACQVTG